MMDTYKKVERKFPNSYLEEYVNEDGDTITKFFDSHGRCMAKIQKEMCNLRFFDGEKGVVHCFDLDLNGYDEYTWRLKQYLDLETRRKRTPEHCMVRPSPNR